MPEYMLVFKVDGETSAIFTDDPIKVDQLRMDAECGLGGRVQVYQWKTDPEDGDRYEFLYE